ncbi:hypothetical protein ACN077_08540 [Clostridium chromiireducens]
MKEGKTLRIGKKVYRIISEYLDFYLAVSEIGFDLKIIPKLRVIK